MHPDGLIQNIVARMVALYGDGARTSNVHHLLHIAKVVTKLGPLWVYSTFVFEGGNGRLLKSVTAANGLPFHVVERAVVAQGSAAILDSHPSK